MKNLFKPEMIKSLLSILVLLLMVKLLWFVVQVLWLSAVDIDQEKDQESKALYYRVKLTPNQAAAPRVAAPKVIAKVQGSIKELTLLGIYNDDDVSVVTVMYKKNTKVLSIGDGVNGFILDGAGKNFAMFSKNTKHYKILLAKNGKSITTSNIEAPKKEVKPSHQENQALGEVTETGGVRIIDRSLLEHYAENMDDIYKNVGISEVRKGKDLNGFKINFVRKDSPFAKLGIRRNDMIKSINGQEIKSYNTAFDIYKNIKNVENLSLVITRNKEEMELEYEIN